MNYIIENWYLIVATACIIFMAAVYIKEFCAKPTDEQLAKIKKWLLYAVTECEAQLGSGTGRLKLSMCYNMFVQAFPALAAIVPFEVFSKLVDDALDEMKEMLNEQPIAMTRLIEAERHRV